MRPALLLPTLLVGATIVAPSVASAGVAHTVQPGETLWSLAAAQERIDGLTKQLDAFRQRLESLEATSKKVE